MVVSIVHITDIQNLAIICNSTQSWEQNILVIVRPTEKREDLFFPKQMVVIKPRNFVGAISQLANLFGGITFARRKVSTAFKF